VNPPGPAVPPPGPAAATESHPSRNRGTAPAPATIGAMARAYTLLLLVDLALLMVALFDCLSADERTVRALPRSTWVFVILLASPIGAIAWFVKGQPEPAIRLANGRLLRPAGPACIGPDDDPAFLQSLTAELHRRADEGRRANEG